MAKLERLSEGMLYFHCPGCGREHGIDGRWVFSGNFDKPTFTPSYLLTTIWGKEQTQVRCHSFITDGRIQFLNDCTHALAGQTVDMVDI